MADLPGWDQPDTIKGVRPDLGARRQRHETLIEIETPEPEKSKRNEKQKRIFKQWSEKGEHRDFKRIITEE